MATARRVLPGKSYLITRRCFQRTFRLRPSLVTNAIFLYCLALAAQKTGVLVHATVVMSDHHHTVITDIQGLLPIFLRELHRTVAKALNASQGQWENLWSLHPTSVVELASEQDIIDKIAYVVANPVRAGLVSRPEDWPGLLLWEDGVHEAVRPELYFDPAGNAPPVVPLRIVSAPPCLSSDHERDEWRRRLKMAIDEHLSEAHREVQSSGMEVLGADGALAQSFLKRATTYEKRRRSRPRIAASDPVTRRLLRRALQEFEVAYRAALKKWRDGDRQVLFPLGTWWMRVHHGAMTDDAAAVAA
jgi:putative transposase